MPHVAAEAPEIACRRRTPVPDGTGVPKAAVVGDAEPRGVVAAVLELLETG